jgi:hypothetical protein
MQFTDLEARRNSDGSIDLRFSTDTAIQTVSLAPSTAPLLLSAAILTAGDVMAAHDGFRIGQADDGRPVLSFRFGQDKWLSILLGPLDLETLASVLSR